MDKTTASRRTATGSNGFQIRGLVWTDDQQRRCRFDAAGWFATAYNEDIAELHAADYRGAPADTLAYFAHEQERNKAIAVLFRYLTVYKPRNRHTGSIIGFEVTLNPFDVYHYLKDKRPELCDALFPNGEPEFRTC
jgi:hypothetical protein